MDELYLDNIDEYVNDHDKIVTYKWLSLTLGVHVNIAKQMLFHYLDHKRRESSAQLHATYLVSGKFMDNGQRSHRVSVVREDQLEDFKSKMSLIVSVHVYSVQKALLKDSGPLYSVDYDAVKDNFKNCSRYSAIRCASAVPMSPLELQQQAPTPEPAAKKPAVNGDASTTSKPAAKPAKGIMGMFASKPAPKNQEGGKDMKTEEKEDAPPAVVVPKNKPAAKANPMTNFFGNQTAKKPEKAVKEEEPTESCSRVEEKQPSPPPKEKEKEPESAPRDTKKDSRSKTKRVELDSDSEDEKMEKKRRRRIKKPQPDSSDEDVIPDSPQPVEKKEPSPPPKQSAPPKEEAEPVSHSHSSISGAKIRKRRRVLKSQTFLDDEGSMVTEKGYVSESYSEEEDDFQAAKQPARNQFPAKLAAEKKSQKKSAVNKGSKQASIMGFFQKK